MRVIVSKKFRFFAYIAMTSMALCSTNAWAACSLVDTYEDTVKVLKTDDGLITYTTNVDVNTDGALSSYKVDDLGYFKAGKKGVFTNSALNTICNGVSIRNKNDELVFNYKKCGKLIAEFKRIREFGWIKPGENYVDFYAIARSDVKTPGKNRGIPCVKDGYYVSMTAKAIQSSKPVCDPERWVDSLRIPAIVMPLNKAMKDAGVKLFDVAIVRAQGSGDWIGAIVGDTNPSKIGEGTVNLNRRIKGLSDDPKNYQSALGYVVGKADYIVFPGSNIRLGTITNSDDGKIQTLAKELSTEYNLESRDKLCP